MRLEQNLSRTVFRLRNLPNHVRDKDTAAGLVAIALSSHVENITIFSLANTSNVWENPPSRIATLQLHTLPDCLSHAKSDNEWQLPLPGGKPEDVLLLDIHFKGLTALNDVDLSSNHRFDCIAIPGLASHPFGSWQPHGNDKTFMWIRDSIPRSVPGARALLYGYDSNLLANDSFQTISDIAQAFILHLKSGGWNLPSSKPIVFLAHSLGGLVLKEAIVQMADREKSVAQILDHVLGAIMFGVPSLGMDQSHLLSMVEGRPNEQLVQDLARDGGANYVRQLNTRFQGLTFLRTAKVIWAYETKESPTVIKQPDGTWGRSGHPAVLVNPDSATCHNYRRNRSVTIPINQDHSGMVKFSRGDSDLGIIIDAIASLYSTEPSVSQVQYRPSFPGASSPTENSSKHKSKIGGIGRDETILEELGAFFASLAQLHSALYLPDLDFRMNQIDAPFQDTFHWIFDLPIFSKWLQEGSGLFWIRGKPGSGKSTLMKFICQSEQTWNLMHDWRTGSMEIQASFFFHYRGSAVQKSLEGVLRSLVVQLLKPFVRMYEEQHLATWKSFQQLKTEKIRAEDKLQSIYLSIDRIDEALDALEGTTAAEQSPEDPSQEPGVSSKSPVLCGECVLQQKGLHREKKALIQECVQIDEDLQNIGQSVKTLAGEFRPSRNTPITLFLKELISIFQDSKDTLIPKAERLLRCLLDQNIVNMDLVLFFDALDEFSGHMDVISRFLKDLAQHSPKSLTRLKVCFSSRPWPELSVHFSKVPGFALQDHTRYDMEQYVSGSVTAWGMASDDVLYFVPKIIDRSDGVFLWVKLALGVLKQTFMSNPDGPTLRALEKKLFQLPEDLFQFYELIIKRISSANRRRTFALIELLVRHNEEYGPISATQIRDAVLVSSCSNYGQAQMELRKSRRGSGAYRTGRQDHVNLEESVRDDLTSWGGGLVEIVPDIDNVDRPQLMHQTVLEFTMGLSFKRIVLGNTANIMYENGHSFHLKYWASTTNWQKKLYAETISAVDLNSRSLLVPRVLYRFVRQGDEETAAVNHAAYHAQQSELTAGRSHFGFLISLPRALPPEGEAFDSMEENLRQLLFLAICCGLTLCVQDCIAAIQKLHPDLKQPMVSRRFFRSSDLMYLLVDPPLGQIHEHYFHTVRVLLETFGYHPVADSLGNQDKLFVNLLLQTLRLELNCDNLVDSPLLKVVNLVLEYGDSHDLPLTLEIPRPAFPEKTMSSLHIAPAHLIPTLVSKGFNPNACDWMGRTPLDLALLGEKLQILDGITFDRVPRIEEIRQRYETSLALIKSGGQVRVAASQQAVSRALIDFKLVGSHDVFFLVDELTAQLSANNEPTDLLGQVLTADTEELERLRWQTESSHAASSWKQRHNYIATVKPAPIPAQLIPPIVRDNYPQLTIPPVVPDEYPQRRGKRERLMDLLRLRSSERRTT